MMILDEVHLAPADIFRKVTTEFRSHVKLGLTATMVREDNLVEDLPYLVGPTIHELDTLDLRMRRYIVPVYCHEINVPLTPQFQDAYHQALSAQERRLLCVCNPNKLRVVMELIEIHVRNGSKVLVYSDDIWGLNFYHQQLNKPALCKKNASLAFAVFAC